MMKLIDKYISTQVFAACCVCIILFMVVWIAPELLLKTIQRTLSGMYTVKMGVSILVYELPKILANALPVGMLLGSIFTFDRLSKDFEITVLRSVGASFKRIIIPVVILSVFVAILTYFVSDRLLPYSSNKLNVIRNENPSSHFVFPVKDKNNRMEKIIIVSSFDKSTIKDVVVLNFYDNAVSGSSLLKSIYIADYANYNRKSWVLPLIKKYQITEDGVFKDVGVQKNVVVLHGGISRNAFKLMQYSLKDDRELTNSQMNGYLKLLKKEKMDDEYRFMLNKYLQRFLHPIMCILFAILGCLLGFSQPREQRLIGFTAAVAAIFLYYITMPFFDLLAEKGIVTPYLTATIPLICTIVTIYFIYKYKDL